MSAAAGAMSIPSEAIHPPGPQKSFCMSITTIAVLCKSSNSF
jgi:hypothetical protein